MEKLRFEVIAFNKENSDVFTRLVCADTKEEFNTQFDEFCNSVPFTKLWYEIIPELLDKSDEKLINKQKEIIKDHEEICLIL